MTFQEEASFSHFFQYVEDSGLRTYDGLVIQNASDISRESDRVRNQTNWTYLQEKHQKKRRQEEAVKRTGEDVSMAADGAYSGKHFRMGFMTMPAPQDRLPPSSQGFTVRSQSLHSVGGGEDDSSHSRKQPPPKPRRDPNTKLSSSSEAVDKGSGFSEAVEAAEAHCHIDDFKKMPPPKPKRNPNTQLSSSFDESYIGNHSKAQIPADTDEEEPVYIEMVGNILRELKNSDVLDAEQSESVYEEMKYPIPEDFQSTVMHPKTWSSRDSLCDIPPPFPNLLSHRPPLLVFPPAPAQCSPNSDESPLTPLDVSRLPMLEDVNFSKPSSADSPQSSTHHHKDRDLPSTHTITSSGRSSAPPLPSSFYKSSGSTHSGHGYPRSQSACPSPVSMGRSLTPLSLKRPPAYETLVAVGSIPHSSSSSSSSSHKAGEGGAKLSNSSSTYGSMHNVSIRSQTPTSPMEEQNTMKRSSGGRKGREVEGDSRTLPRHDKRDVHSNPMSSRIGRSSVSPTMFQSGGESQAVCKLGRSASTSVVPSPFGTPPRHLEESQHPALSQD
ncbi:neuronal tyrosine-phosphorylated phosphoinositide-3-kinase adapter 2 isoform X2 [Oryzias melastigma]|uniref:Neuronal tyrosine-phosphorylated phosphoinositide-3-kinase adaptor 2 n=1 Tax=Oryzias melastigma TaxID=30732 RepID=A0A3B3CCT8_ORYME|nr:neuronal tyrosine-phosphorylated phosphoinositide-3-kinase adapter 2 isoform X2 [Oryzias melastigma]